MFFKLSDDLHEEKKANDDGHDNDNNHSDTHSTLALSHLSSRRREKSVSHPKRPTTGVSPQRRLGQAHYAPHTRTNENEQNAAERDQNERVFIYRFFEDPYSFFTDRWSSRGACKA